MKSIHITEDSLPLAWEKSVVACWEQGDNFPTQYDKPGDSNSRDVLAVIHVKNPLAEPRIHKGIPAGINDLEKYRSEVLYGVHDHWVNPAEGKWEYTYHQRLFEYALPNGLGYNENFAFPNSTINQIQACIDMLKKCGFTRRAQAITWKPWEDLGISDPACLQRVWFRVEECESEEQVHEFPCSCPKPKVAKLNMTVHMRSNDAYKAAFMNMYAFVELQAYVAEQVGVEVGEYVHIADSYHIYGSYFNDFEGFLKMLGRRQFEDRIYRTTDATVVDEMIVGCDQLLEEKGMPLDKVALVKQRRAYLETLVS